MPPGISLRARTDGDEHFLADLFKAIHTAEFLLLGLSSAALDQLLAMQWRAQGASYASQFPHAVDHVIWSGEERIGRLLVDRSGAVWHLVDIALAPAYRGQGVGTRLIRALVAEANQKEIPLRLSVRPGNPAARLYQRLGFAVIEGDGLNLLMEFRAAGHAILQTESDGSAQGTQDSVRPDTSGAYFRTLTGKHLGARTADGTQMLLTLERVEMLRAGADRSAQAIDPGDSFTLRLSGPLLPELPAGIVDIAAEDAASLTIFLVPIARHADRMEYEAVFNRAAPRRF